MGEGGINASKTRRNAMLANLHATTPATPATPAPIPPSSCPSILSLDLLDTLRQPGGGRRRRQRSVFNQAERTTSPPPLPLQPPVQDISALSWPAFSTALSLLSYSQSIHPRAAACRAVIFCIALQSPATSTHSTSLVLLGSVIGLSIVLAIRLHHGRL